MIKRVGILTGGGDVPGLNPCIKALVNRAEEEGLEAVGLRRGWGGLVAIDLDRPETIEANAIELNRAMVRTIDRTGGTWLPRAGPRRHGSCSTRASLGRGH